ncbi:hypothetical protein V5799_000623 [Amblyomma americanum]|uniref:Uncharacterized protein n=1 Tax=Amblyomma americanum TaxID=6943 RepID=A0AAQ4D2I5_AMBAM
MTWKVCRCHGRCFFWRVKLEGCEQLRALFCGFCSERDACTISFTTTKWQGLPATGSPSRFFIIGRPQVRPER